MIATVTMIDGTRVMAKVRRNHKSESIYQTEANHKEVRSLKAGDRIEVKRVVNNPYLVYVGKE